MVQPNAVSAAPRNWQQPELLNPNIYLSYTQTNPPTSSYLNRWNRSHLRLRREPTLILSRGQLPRHPLPLCVTLLSSPKTPSSSKSSPPLLLPRRHQKRLLLLPPDRHRQPLQRNRLLLLLASQVRLVLELYLARLQDLVLLWLGQGFPGLDVVVPLLDAGCVPVAVLDFAVGGVAEAGVFAGPVGGVVVCEGG